MGRQEQGQKAGPHLLMHVPVPHIPVVQYAATREAITRTADTSDALHHEAKTFSSH